MSTASRSSKQQLRMLDSDDESETLEAVKRAELAQQQKNATKAMDTTPDAAPSASSSSTPESEFKAKYGKRKRDLDADIPPPPPATTRGPFEYESKEAPPSPKQPNNTDKRFKADNVDQGEGANGGGSHPPQTSDYTDEVQDKSEAAPKSESEKMEYEALLKKNLDMFRRDGPTFIDNLILSLDDPRLKDYPTLEERERHLSFYLNIKTEDKGTNKDATYFDIYGKGPERDARLEVLSDNVFVTSSTHFPFGSATDKVVMKDDVAWKKKWDQFPGADKKRKAYHQISLSNQADVFEKNKREITYVSFEGKPKTVDISYSKSKLMATIRKIEKYIVQKNFRHLLQVRLKKFWGAKSVKFNELLLEEAHRGLAPKIMRYKYDPLKPEEVAKLAPSERSAYDLEVQKLRRFEYVPLTITDLAKLNPDEKEEYDSKVDAYNKEVSDIYKKMPDQDKLQILEESVHRVLNDDKIFKSQIRVMDKDIAKRVPWSDDVNVIMMNLYAWSASDKVHKQRFKGSKLHPFAAAHKQSADLFNNTPYADKDGKLITSDLGGTVYNVIPITQQTKDGARQLNPFVDRHPNNPEQPFKLDNGTDGFLGFRVEFQPNGKHNAHLKLTWLSFIIWHASTFSRVNTQAKMLSLTSNMVVPTSVHCNLLGGGDSQKQLTDGKERVAPPPIKFEEVEDVNVSNISGPADGSASSSPPPS